MDIKHNVLENINTKAVFSCCDDGYLTKSIVALSFFTNHNKDYDMHIIGTKFSDENKKLCKEYNIGVYEVDLSSDFRDLDKRKREKSYPIECFYHLYAYKIIRDTNKKEYKYLVYIETDMYTCKKLNIDFKNIKGVGCTYRDLKTINTFTPITNDLFKISTKFSYSKETLNQNRILGGLRIYDTSILQNIFFYETIISIYKSSLEINAPRYGDDSLLVLYQLLYPEYFTLFSQKYNMWDYEYPFNERDDIHIFHFGDKYNKPWINILNYHTYNSLERHFTVSYLYNVKQKFSSDFITKYLPNIKSGLNSSSYHLALTTDFRIVKNIDILSIGRDLLDYYNINKIEISMKIQILNEILIGAWYAEPSKKLSLEVAKEIEKIIYGTYIGTNSLTKTVIKNLSYHNIEIDIGEYPMVMFKNTSYNNYGDVIALYLYERLFKIKLLKTSFFDTKDHYVTMGSILSQTNSKSVVWGSGYIANERCLKYGTPQKILCVRGPLTRAKLLIDSVSCPEKYGDPALLFPLIFIPKIGNKRYRYGFIPHFVDKRHPVITDLANHENTLFIDIETGDRPLHLIEEICKCDMIISSSLHGLIMAVAYKIPCVWVGFSDKVIGNTFKFYDFFFSFGYDSIGLRIDMTNEKEWSSLLEDKVEERQIVIGNDKLYKIGKDLLETNPFKIHYSSLLEKWKLYAK